jgi:hypothetical protein
MATKDTPDFQNAAYGKMYPAWEVLTDVLAGQDTIKAAKHNYLPKAPAELPDDYDRRLARSLFFEDYRDCVVNLTGMVFRKSPTLGDDVPPILVELAENIDNAGTHFDVFTQRVFEDGFFGHSFVVVDRAQQDPNVKTAADEIATGSRSYWCMRQAKDALNWRTSVVNGRTILTQITFKECTKEPDGAFGEVEVIRYRVYRLNESGNAEWQLWKEVQTANSTQKEVILEDQGPILTKRSLPLKRLPIAVHYGEHEGFLESRPPLKGIADINLAYYQKYSDLTNIQHFTCAVTLALIGGDDQKTDLTMGGNRVLWLPMGADAKFLEVDGDSIPALERDLEMLQKRLVAKGLDFLESDAHRVPSTATEVLLAYTTRTSKLARMVRSVIDCTEEALDITAEMEGLDEGGSITLGVDENSLTITPDQLRTFSEMNEKGQMSLQTLWQMMSRADQLPEDFDETKELALVKQAALDQMELNAKQFDAGLESTP